MQVAFNYFKSLNFKILWVLFHGCDSTASRAAEPLRGDGTIKSVGFPGAHFTDFGKMKG